MKMRTRFVALGLLVLTVLGAGGLALAAGEDAAEQSGLDAAVQASLERRQDPTDYRSSEGALAFPAGTSYSEAIVALRLIEAGAPTDLAPRVVPRLPAGTVAVTGSGELILDLAAPYGYDVELGAAISPTYVFDGDPEGTPKSRYGPWFVGSSLLIPDLPDCMVSSSRADQGQACGPQDKVGSSRAVLLP